MITVCIPVYNADVRVLARQLSGMAASSGIAVELLFFDDFSEARFRAVNREIMEIRGVVYHEGERNMGRSALRNYLGKIASHPWLLFMDADCLPVSGNFLKSYAAETGENRVICGGTRYSDEPPAGEKLLRWTYGKAREALTAAQRSAKNSFAITANNFMIRKETLAAISFRESIREYGHEDTVLGYDLSTAAIPIGHIDNPVYHTGLEASAVYLEKTRTAIDNLVKISEEEVTDPVFIKGSGLLRTGSKLRKTGLLPVVAWFFRMGEPLIRKNLTGPHPRLFLFDLYRTGYLCSIS